MWFLPNSPFVTKLGSLLTLNEVGFIYLMIQLQPSLHLVPIFFKCLKMRKFSFDGKNSKNCLNIWFGDDPWCHRSLIWQLVSYVWRGQLGNWKSVSTTVFVGEVRLGTPLHLPLIDGYQTNTISITPTIEEWFVFTGLE